MKNVKLIPVLLGLLLACTVATVALLYRWQAEREHDREAARQAAEQVVRDQNIRVARIKLERLRVVLADIAYDVSQGHRGPEARRQLPDLWAEYEAERGNIPGDPITALQQIGQTTERAFQIRYK